MSFRSSPEFFRRIPTEPGVYLMKDSRGRVVYVGKAKNLRNRVRQYFRPGDDDRTFVATGLLGRVLADVETMIVDTEKEALLLENHLIKEHQPRFNIKLRDDKQYLVLRIDPGGTYPRVEAVRNIEDDGARYFGPYHSATSCRRTLRTLNRHFQLRTCSDHVLANRKRPCLQYQIKRCPGPCVFDIDKEEYGRQVDDVIMFLSGKDSELSRRLEARMLAAAEREDFEYAAWARDSMRAVERSLAAQKVVQESFVDQDVIGLWRDHDRVELAVMFVRAGKLVGSRRFKQREQEFSDQAVLAAFVQQYYASGTVVPDEVIVGDLEGHEVLEEWLSSLRGKRIKILRPRRGVRSKLLALANRNAEASAVARGDREQDAVDRLEKLQQRLSLSAVPRRIECFDIAHIQGTETVASMVVFIDGVPAKSHYRKFRIRTATNDDFTSMFEVLSRRFRRAHQGSEGWEMPDLLVIDGGKGQLGRAVAALEELGIDARGQALDIVSLAKPREDSRGKSQPDRVFRVGIKDPIALRANTTELFVLSHIRDEAHRFANEFHRSSRRKKSLRSRLDDVPGVGEKRRNALLRHFGSLKAIRLASVEELASLPGMSTKVAQAIHEHFQAPASKS